MKKEHIPAPIGTRIAKLVLCAAAMFVTGVIWSLKSHDTAFLLLSTAVLVAGIFKACIIAGAVKAGHYEVARGTVQDLQAVPGRKTLATILTEEDEVVQLLLAGCQRLDAGRRYQIYLSQGQKTSLERLPTALRSAQTVLGAEAIPEETS